MQIFSRKKDQTSIKDDAAPNDTVVRRIRILAVDENPTALSVIGRRLSHMGYDVVLAENGFVGLNMLLAQKFDAILIDAGMTMMTGIATMKKMRASGMLANASIIMITGRSDNAGIVEALNVGADDQIVKPFDFDILDARIRHAVARAAQLEALSRYNEILDARIARRAVELGETRASLEDLRMDRSRLVASIQALHAEVERLSARN